MPHSLQWILDHQEDLAARALTVDPDTLDDVSTPEMVLRRAAWRRAQTEREIIEAVAEARGEGITWQQIGTALGTTRQSAQRRYANAVKNLARPAGRRR